MLMEVEETERRITLEEEWENEEYRGFAVTSQIHPAELMASMRSTAELLHK